MTDNSQTIKKETPGSIKKKLKKELDLYLGSGTVSAVASRAGVSRTAVRKFFSMPQRRSPEIDKAAFDLLAELKEDIRQKSDVINS